ncbi:SARP family transcriptional regulator [Paractinoplanes deccanensis]|uniref:SARP family transcriptional regulator n=1 Tax=Paractinoplanes deccanensis TaxID=113561 RepID=A0ABQ3XUM4_9ACTN|nr:BTAD domain-containing putative transcriptional regulator [Actinoplanes deccanensis]GID71441.1 SARP family transcriptional regulator [Actinoplanes deccanensis]
MRYRLLGPVAVDRDGASLPLGGPKPRAVLAALLLEAGRVVPEERLIALVWGDDPPPTVRGQLQVHVSGLRKLLGADRIVRRPPGYLLDVRPGELDLDDFARAVERARRDGTDDPARLADGLRSALAMWSGPVLGGTPESLLSRVAPALRERRSAVLEEMFEAEIAAGRHADVVGELVQAARDQPYREGLHGLLMTALHRAGRTAEALEVYAALRDGLADELGVEPGAPLQAVRLQVLQGAPAADGAAPVPRQLPADLVSFAGRAEALARLDAVLDGAGAPVRVAAVVGTAGVGKTTLAVHWAHRVRQHFPDGQLYVNLRGFDTGGGVEPAEAVRGFLDAFAVPPERLGFSFEAQVGLYRSIIAGKRVLVVLDNARDAEQVRPLLPGTAGCFVVVTSRVDLTALVAAEGAYQTRLDLPSDDEAREMLERRLGADRVAAESAAVRTIIAASARLPLALAVVAARAANHPGSPLAAIAGELTGRADVLDLFDGGAPGTDLRAVLHAPYRMLGPDAARLFRLLSLHPGPDVTVPAIAALAGLPRRQARRAVAELTRASLLTERVLGRFTFHDLLREYSAELAGAESGPELRAARRRLLDHYLHTALAADRLLNPQRDPIAALPRGPEVVPEEFPGAQQALAWFTAEYAAMVDLIERSAGDFPAHAWQLAWTLATFFDRQGHWDDYVASHLAALEAARRLGDHSGQAHTHRNLARAYTRLTRYADAGAELRRALALHERIGDRTGRAQVHGNLSWLLEKQNRNLEALVHSQQAMVLYRQLGDATMEANALNTVGWQYALLGRYERAIKHCAQALELLAASGDRFGEAVTWDSLGYVHQRRGDHEQAVEAYERALAVFREMGDRTNETKTLVQLGDTYLAAGDQDRARATWLRAATMLDELGLPRAAEVHARLRGDFTMIR